MSNRTNEQRAARHLQALTNWSYSECLRLTESESANAIEALAKVRGKAIDQAHERYPRWRQRMGHIRREGA